MRRPTGVSQRDFDAALDAFRRAVGREWVFTSDEDVALYRDPYSASWGEPDERIASAAVAPASTEEVQAVVRTANRLKIPLYAISTGKNLTYGGPAPNLSGSVVVDLKRMGKIEVDEKACGAIVEPGVSFFDFYRHTQERGLKVWANLPDPGWGSLMGNALERGVGHSGGPWRDRFSSVCGLEVVLPNGEVMRTGMAAVPNAKTWLSYPYGYGPHVSGLFSGANFGIVTKMGLWLYPEPEAYRAGTVNVPRRADLGPMIEIVNYLEQSGLIGEVVFRSPLNQLRNDATYKAISAKPGDWTDAEVDRLAQDNNLPSWAVDLQFYGPEKGIAANWEFVKDRFTAAVKGATFKDGQAFRFPMTPEQIANEGHLDAFGIPSLAIFALGRDRLPTPFDGHLDFSPILPRTAEAVFEAQRVFAKAGADIGAINVYTGGPVSNPFQTPMAWRARDFIFFMSLATSRTDPKINATSRATFKHFIQVAADHGWAEYRAGPAFQDEVMGIYSFNNHALRRFSETLKDAIDPNGILSAGRGGIWPRHLRGKRS